MSPRSFAYINCITFPQPHCSDLVQFSSPAFTSPLYLNLNLAVKGGRKEDKCNRYPVCFRQITGVMAPAASLVCILLSALLCIPPSGSSASVLQDPSLGTWLSLLFNWAQSGPGNVGLYLKSLAEVNQAILSPVVNIGVGFGMCQFTHIISYSS